MRLFICEKPSQARDIARNLGATTKAEGFISGANGVVTWCFGHLLEQASPDAYDPALKSWSLSTLPILPSHWKMVTKKESKKQFNIIKSLLEDADEVVNAGDPDREGESIVQEILDLCNYTGKVSRLWLSALDDVSVKKALNDLRPAANTHSLYLSALARSRADWLVGMNLTRAFTVASTASDVLNVGRVQTPTLSLVVSRDLEIENFKPQDYFDVEAVIHRKGEPNNTFKAKWLVPEHIADEEGRCLERKQAETVVTLSHGLGGRIVKAETNKKKEAAPLPLDLSTLQQLANAKFGYGADKTLQIAQALYETHKATTYPRTDCRYLPNEQEVEIEHVFASIASTHDGLGELCFKADRTKRSKAWNTKKVTAHHAIIPTTTPANFGAMNTEERNVYELVARYFMAQFFPDHEYEQTVLEADFASNIFRATGRVELVSGWHTVLKQAKSDDAQSLPKLRHGDDCTCIESSIKALQTKPPKRYTEGTLIAAMKNIGRLVTDPELKKVLRESAGLGTEATRAGTIKSLIDRKSISTKGKELISTQKGRDLIKALPEELTKPELTAQWEQQLEMIVENTLTLDAFTLSQHDYITNIVNKVKGGDIKVEVTVAGGADNSCDCTECEGVMSRKKGPKGYFWGCSNYPTCRATLPDNKGKPSAKAEPKAAPVLTDKDCPKCGKKLRLVTSKTGKQFLSCNGWPECDHMEWPRDPNLDDCPKCGEGQLVERVVKKGKSRGLKFHSCSAYPKCDHTVWPK